jgi:hypothetical protein
MTLRAIGVLLAGIAATVSAQVREAPRFSGGTAVLTGTVVSDEPSPQPIRRALVTVTATGDARMQLQTTTDDSGRFVVARLQPGNFRVAVSKPGYVLTYHGAPFPGSTIDQPVALANGKTSDIRIRLPRGAVIAGTIADDRGQPMPGVSIRIQRVSRSATGERLLTPLTGALIPTTDDRGQFRIFGLPAGEYVVLAQPRLPGTGEVRQTTQAELDWADRQMRGGGAGRGTAPETVALPTRPTTVTYAPVYFPGTVGVASAGVIALAAGQERSGADIRMQLIATARVSGSVTLPDGSPARGMQVLLLSDAGGTDLQAQREALLVEMGLASGNLASTSGDGSFSIAGVSPGDYTLVARTAPAGARAGAAAPAQALWATAQVRVNGEDIPGIAMRLAAGQTVSGRIAIEAAPDAAAAPMRVTVSLRPAGSRGLAANLPAIPVDSSGASFSIDGVIPGAYRLAATVSNGALKSAIVEGKDMADVPVDVRPGQDLAGVNVMLTAAPPEVTGVLYDAAGRPSSDLAVILFSVDRAAWYSGSRRVPSAARPATDGRYRFAGLAAGQYYLAVVSDVTVSAADLANPTFLEQLIPAAVRLTLADGERKTQDLRVK